MCSVFEDYQRKPAPRATAVFSPGGWLAPARVAAAVLLFLHAAVVCALITRPMPSGAVMVIAATAGTVLGLFSLQDALSGYANVTVWLIVAAFLFSRAFIKTRLGERIAYSIVE